MELHFKLYYKQQDVCRDNNKKSSKSKSNLSDSSKDYDSAIKDTEVIISKTNSRSNSQVN